jgi:1-acyl-sn-glycerol-3-phosphate acyltransferase
MMYTLATKILLIFLLLFYRFRVMGKEHLPKSGGFVIACTHTGWIDIVALGVAVYPYKIHFMAKQELFQYRFSRWLLSNLQSFPVKRENPGPSSLKIPIRLLKKGEVVGIFPTGTRTEEMTSLKRGAVYLAEKAHVPIVPAVYLGPSTWSIRHLFRRPAIMIQIGEPLFSTQMEDGQTDLGKQLNGKLRQMHDQLKKLFLFERGKNESNSNG